MPKKKGGVAPGDAGFLDVSASRGKTRNRRSRRSADDSDEGIAANRISAALFPCALPPDNHDEPISSSDASSKLIVVSEGQTGERLDAYLSSVLPDITRTRVTRACKEDCVLVDEVARKASYKVRAGQRILFAEPQAQPLRVAPEDIPLDILYEDQYILVINKPAGMAVHPAGGLISGTLVNALLHHLGQGEIELCEEDAEDESKRREFREGVVRPGIIHRLDRHTSGVMVCAKDPLAHSKLHDQFGNRTTHRLYDGIVCGIVESQGTITGNIGRDPRDRLKMAIVAEDQGKSAVTHFTVQETLAAARLSLLEFKLETGRTHQIRVHAASRGWPLLGDDIYGGLLDPLMPRQALHAKLLEFEHPISHERMRFEAKWPDDFNRVMGKPTQLDDT